MKKAIYLVSTHGYFDVDPQTLTVACAGRLDTGGQTVYTVELAKALGRAGYPTFLVTRWFHMENPELQKIGPNVWILRLKSFGFRFLPKEQIYPVLPALVDNLVSFIRVEWKQMFQEAHLKSPESVEPALFHGHYVDGGIVAQAASRTFRVPFFWTSHSLGALKRERSRQLPPEEFAALNFEVRIPEEARLIRKAMKHGGLTVTAKTEAEDIRRLYDLELDEADFEFIPPRVDTLKFRSLIPGEVDPPVDRAPPAGLPVVLMGGRWAHTKGFNLGMMAFHQALTGCPNAQLAIFGGSKPEGVKEEEGRIQDELETYREEKRIARQVHLLGPQEQDDMPRIYRLASVFIQPSRHEPFGMVTLEAIACGIPVVVSSHAGVSKELEHGVHAMIADPNEPVEFADCIRKLLGNPELAARIGRQGQEHVNGRFTWEGSASLHLEFWARKGAKF